MAYQVTTETSNGYRCGCCQRSWENSEWYNDLEDALDCVPTHFPGAGDYETMSVTVMDGSTGEEIAWARATWSTGFEKYSGNWYTRWKGYRPDTGDFEEITGKEPWDGTWEELQNKLGQERYKKDVVKAERELKEAQERLAKLQGGLG